MKQRLHCVAPRRLVLATDGASRPAGDVPIVPPAVDAAAFLAAVCPALATWLLAIVAGAAAGGTGGMGGGAGCPPNSELTNPIMTP